MLWRDLNLINSYFAVLIKGLLKTTNLFFIAVVFKINIELTAKETDLPSREC